jgi:hypothetical protein
VVGRDRCRAPNLFFLQKATAFIWHSRDPGAAGKENKGSLSIAGTKEISLPLFPLV